MSLKAEGGFVEDFYKPCRGLRGHLITNFSNLMVLVCNTMIDEEIYDQQCFEFFWDLMFAHAC